MADKQPAKKKTTLTSVRFMDHTPSILSIYPAVIFAILAGMLALNIVSGSLCFWIFLGVSGFWYASERYDFDRTGAIIAVTLVGMLVFGTIAAELYFKVEIFKTISSWLGNLEPSFNAAFLVILSAAHFINFFGSVAYAHYNQRYEVGSAEIKRLRMGGRDMSMPRQGLTVEYEPIDYLELLLLGAGRVTIKTRGGSVKFQMDRAIGLYRSPLLPWTWFGNTLQHKIDKIMDISGVFRVDHGDDLYDDDDDGGDVEV